AYSPDGRFIAILTQNLRRSPVDANRVAIIERRSGALKVKAADWDGGIHAPLQWDAESSALLFCAEEDARQGVYRLPMGAKAPEPVARGGMVTDFALSAGGIAFVRSTMSTPPAVFWNGGKGEARIDRFNDDV